VKRNPLTFKSRCWLWTKGAVWFIGWGAPLGAIGIAACIPVITAPIGLVVLYIAALPLANMVKHRSEEVRKWKMSPTPGLTTDDLDEEFQTMLEDEPWNERDNT
jgi:hypothetical protein